MKKLVLTLTFIATVFSGPRAKADLFGGDVAVLSQILVQAIQQLAQLREIFGAAKDNLELVRQINQGINDSLHLLKTVDPNLDPGLYREWVTVQEAVARIEKLYGEISVSPEAQIQRDTDRGVAEAIAFNNAFYSYTKELDAVGERLKVESHNASPGGAQKMTAQALGLIIQVLNQNLRAQATSLKLQGQAMAVENRREKAETKHFIESSDALRSKLKLEKAAFSIPRF